MTAPRPLPSTDRPWHNNRWDEANQADLGTWVALACAAALVVAAVATRWRR